MTYFRNFGSHVNQNVSDILRIFFEICGQFHDIIIQAKCAPSASIRIDINISLGQRASLERENMIEAKSDRTHYLVCIHFFFYFFSFPFTSFCVFLLFASKQDFLYSLTKW
jgi:hypothetical protein